MKHKDKQYFFYFVFFLLSAASKLMISYPSQQKIGTENNYHFKHSIFNIVRLFHV